MNKTKENKNNWTTVSKGVYKQGNTYVVRPMVNGVRKYYTFTSKTKAIQYYNSRKKK